MEKNNVKYLLIEIKKVMLNETEVSQKYKDEIILRLLDHALVEVGVTYDECLHQYTNLIEKKGV